MSETKIGSDMAVSVIVPVLNERERLPNNLSLLLADPSIEEVVVVDGGSSDGTWEYLNAIWQDVEHRSRLRILRTDPGRGLQMNAGAAASSNPWLLFHHADSELPTGAGELLANLPESVHWGGFSHQFEPSNWKLRCVSALHNWRARQTGVIYGDQSMFVRRNLFQRVGGFVEEDMEDLRFSDQALRIEPSTLLQTQVRTSSRKFVQIGEFRALAQVLSIIWRYQRDAEVGHRSFFLPYR